MGCIPTCMLSLYRSCIFNIDAIMIYIDAPSAFAIESKTRYLKDRSSEF